MINYTVISAVVAAAIALIVWLVLRNKKDKNEFEQGLNNDYTKPKDDENEM